MLRFLRTLTLMTAAVVAAVVTYTLVTLPPRARILPAPLPPNIVYGAYHVHTTLSDGRATPDAVADAAARAGLAFVILSDHGDGTRPPAAPAYVHGVLVIDAVEISTAAGHLVALGLGRATPYPLGGDPRDVVDDVHRLGGWVVLAHPDSPKPELRWRGGPGGGVGYDAIEWLNADSLWRAASRPDVLRVLARAMFRPAESLATLVDRTAVARSEQRWDAALRSRSVVALAAVDAHGVPGWRGAYEQEFRAIAQAAVLDGPLTHDASTDAGLVLAALRAGHAFSIVTAVARPAAIEITASDGARRAVMGGRIDAPAGETVTIQARVAGAPDARLTLFHNGKAVASGFGDVQISGQADLGSYRAEAYVGGFAAPWIVSNAVSLGPEEAPADRPQPPPAKTLSPLRGDDGPAWTIEHGPSSEGTISAAGAGLDFAYKVGTAAPGREFVALARAMSDPSQAFDRVQFVARADRPMRLSVQLRFHGGADPQRWIRSVYLDETPRPIVVMLSDLTPVGPQGTLRPVVARVQSVLFVVDTLNTPLGAAGHVWLSDIALGNPDQVRTVRR